MDETWKPWPTNPKYEISNTGNVRSWMPWKGIHEPRHPRPMKLCRRPSGHICAFVTVNGKDRGTSVHRMVLEAFVGPCPPGMECRHLNGVPFDNRVENLTWGTASENLADRKRHDPGVMVGERNAHAKLRASDVIAIRAALRSVTSKALAMRYGVSIAAIQAIKKRRSWAHLPEATP